MDEASLKIASNVKILFYAPIQKISLIRENILKSRKQS